MTGTGRMTRRTSQDTQDQESDEGRIPPKSDDFVQTSDLIKLIASVFAGLAGIAAVFSLVGFIVILSFSHAVRLTGLPHFAERFFQEAGLRFLMDFMEELHSPGRAVLFLLITASLLVLGALRRKIPIKGVLTSKFQAALEWGTNSVMFMLAALVLVILALDRSTGQNEAAMTVWLFWIGVPVILSLFAFLIANLDYLKRDNPIRRSVYAGALTLTLALVVILPFAYGRDVYDIVLHRVTAIEFAPGITDADDHSGRSESLMRIRSAITPPEEIDQALKNSLYYLMGNTRTKEVLLAAQPGQFEVHLFDPDVIDYILVDKSQSVLNRDDSYTIRRMIQEARLDPVLPNEIGGDELDDEFHRILEESQ